MAGHDPPTPATTVRQVYLSSGEDVSLPVCAEHAAKYDEAMRAERHVVVMDLRDLKPRQPQDG